MNKRELAQEIATRVDELGFNREHAIKFVDAFIGVIKDAMRASPEHGEFLIQGFGKFRWHRYRGQWIRKTPRVYIKVSMLTYQKNNFFGRCIRRFVRQLYAAPWFIGEEARKSMKGGYPYGINRGSDGGLGSIQEGFNPV